MLTHTRNLVPAVGVSLVLNAIYNPCTINLQTTQYTIYAIYKKYAVYIWTSTIQTMYMLFTNNTQSISNIQIM